MGVVVVVVNYYYKGLFHFPNIAMPRLALNCDLATAWPFAVEGEAFAHRFINSL